MRWGSPDLLWLVVIPVLVLALYAYGHLVRRSLLAKLGEHRLVESLISTFSVQKRLMKQLVVFLAVVLLCVASIRPQYGRRAETLKYTGIDIAIVFDISRSMLVEDIAPNRLEASRQLVQTLLGRLQGHRVGLVPFAGVSYVQSPLTVDQGAIRMYLDQLDPLELSRRGAGGTNLAMAIKQGTRVLTGERDKGEDDNRSRVLLLITDGHDIPCEKGKAAREAAEAARAQGIQIMAVGVGTLSGHFVPQVDENGNVTTLSSVESTLNLDVLEELTNPDSQCGTVDTDAENRRVFEYDGSEQTTQVLVNAFDTLQQSAIADKTRHRYNEKFQYLVLPAIILLLGDLVLSERRRRREDDL